MRKTKGIVLVLITLIFSYFYYMSIKVNIPTFAPYIYSGFICIMAYLAYELYGFPKFNDTPIQITILKGIITTMVVYFFIIYILGIFSGYTKVLFSIDTLSIIISLIAVEVFRYILINANRDSDLFPFLTTLTIIILEISSILDPNMLITATGLTIYVPTLITPVILRNLVLTLYCQHINIRIAILYSIIVMQYKNVIPVVPNLNEFTYSYADILLSFLVLTMSYRIIIKNYEGYPMIGLKDGFSFVDLIIFVIFVIFGILISGVSPIQIYVAKNNIRNISIEKGDAPIVVKWINEFDLKEKDIIFYEEDDTGYKIYAVNKIEETKPLDAKEKPIRKVYIIGEDNNQLEINNKKIKGKVVFNIKYMFKPSLKVKKYLNGGAE